MMMPYMNDKTFWHRHLKEGRYPVIPIRPNQDFAEGPLAGRRTSYSVASFERERRGLRAPDVQQLMAEARIRAERRLAAGGVP